MDGIYAVFALGGAIPLVQVNQSFAQVENVTGFSSCAGYGAILAVLVGFVVIGSARSSAVRNATARQKKESDP